MVTDLNLIRNMWTQSLLVAGSLLVLGAPVALDAEAAEGRQVPDTFRATTVNMTPADVTLKIDVMNWSDDEARADAVFALEADDAATAVAELPTLGYVWISGSAVGYAVKYAHRVADGEGGERITIVTDKPLGAYGLRPWSAESAVATGPSSYSVIELELDADGSGVGTLSLVADVIVDDDADIVSLDRAETVANVLTAAKREPKPYWAGGG